MNNRYLTSKQYAITICNINVENTYLALNNLNVPFTKMSRLENESELK